MAAQAPVNLLPKSDFEQSVWGRFLKWLLTTGRYLIIVTELIVILAFLSRFKLDQDLSNLNESIGQKKRILDALSDTERRFRHTQTRINIAGKMLDNQSFAILVADNLTAKVPPGMTITALGVDHAREVTLDSTALSDTVLSSFLTRMASDKKWKTLDITQITADPSQGIKFSLRATY